jgi:hypothetical protein
MSKYKNLPGVDLSAKDVFESVDVFEPKKKDQNEENYVENENIDKSKISLPTSREKFKDFLLDPSQDFSRSLSALKKKIYKLPNSSLAISNKEFEETPIEKLRRLLFEANELENELTVNNKSSDNEGNKETIFEVLKDLKSQLNSLKEKEKIEDAKKINEMKNLSSPHALHSLPTPFQSSVNCEVLTEQERKNLNKRLERMEQFLGITSQNNDMLPIGNLLSIVDNLDSSLSIITQPANMDLLIKKCSVLSTNFDLILEKKREIEATGYDLEIEKKIDHLYSLLQSTESLCSLVPKVLDRMVALKSLHMEAANFSDVVKYLTETQENIGESVKTSLMVCKKVYYLF